jgi:tetratricopeptide (TPR) repeat protein
MKRTLRWISSLIAVLLIAGCAPKQPPIFQLSELEQQGKYDEAIQLAEKLTAENPDDSQAFRFLVRAARAKGELEKYREKYQRLTEANPDTAGYHFVLGYIYTQLEDFDTAISELRKAIEVKPDIEYAHYVLGWIYINSGYAGADAEKGLVEWEKEEQLDPKSLGALQVYNDRATYYLLIGNGDAAEKDYEKITLYAFAPGDISGARKFVSQIRMLRDELARLEADVKDNPDDAGLRAKLGVLQYKNGRVKDAIETWQKAVELDPDNAELRNDLGKALLEDERYSDAAEHLRKAIGLDSKMVAAHYNLAVAEELLGQPKIALEHYKKYVELNPMAPKLDEVKQKIATLEAQAGAEGG